ncbi:glycoside hydrolase family 3 protein [Fictibacillus sp. B-59209]|uniref:glycoside hydrolase family 3 protein n=1 Tax=Fictibacillus sp. B-59209 TaxID=3024873 RepID=UPI002E207E4A|nr:glycoside hydrolase family 3 protein [Fictibacillus sp. B-59209]
MSEISLKEKIGQLMVFGFEGLTATEEIKHFIQEYRVGSIILFGRNIGNAEDVLKLTTELQHEAKDAQHPFPLLICADQENGAVRRLGEGSTIFPGAMLLGATGKSENAFKTGKATARELKALGINWNLAPVVDVNNNPANPVIGIRSFGEKPEVVSEFGKAFLKGSQEEGVIPTLKHFPGHGDTDIDSHLDLPVIRHTKERLDRVELLPFKEAIENGADVVMTAHVHFPAYEKNEGIPATISKSVITGLLRDDLGFDGVITTDCLEMNAVSKTIGTAQGAVEALKAGVDLLMVSHTYEVQKETLLAVLHAVESGEIDESTIDQAYTRVQRLKESYLNWEHLKTDPLSVQVPEWVGGAEHTRLAQDIYREGITIEANHTTMLPLSNEPGHPVLCIYPQSQSKLQVEDKKYLNLQVEDIIQEIHPKAESFIISNPSLEKEINAIKEKAYDFETIIFMILSLNNENPLLQLMNDLKEEKQVIAMAIRNPYALEHLPLGCAAIYTYEPTLPAITAALRVIFGKQEANGDLPVSIYSCHKRKNK